MTQLLSSQKNEPRPPRPLFTFAAVLQKEKAPQGLPAGHFPVNRTFVLLVVAAPAFVLTGGIRLKRLMGFIRGRQAGGQIHRL